MEPPRPDIELSEKEARKHRKQAEGLAKLEAFRVARDYGELNPVLMCPHCQTRGLVWTKSTTVKQGISGGKATGAVLTAGVSLIATGLSRKNAVTQAYCQNCGSRWLIQ